MSRPGQAEPGFNLRVNSRKNPKKMFIMFTMFTFLAAPRFDETRPRGEHPGPMFTDVHHDVHPWAAW
jgi:hypothetical protein